MSITKTINYNMSCIDKIVDIQIVSLLLNLKRQIIMSQSNFSCDQKYAEEHGYSWIISSPAEWLAKNNITASVAVSTHMGDYIYKHNSYL